jgi:hypothetical protein
MANRSYSQYRVTLNTALLSTLVILSEVGAYATAQPKDPEMPFLTCCFREFSRNRNRLAIPITRQLTRDKKFHHKSLR